MAKLNLLLIAMILVLLMIAFNPQTRAQTLDIWDSFRPVLTNIKEGLTVIFHVITNNTSDVPSEDTPPVNDGPVYNANLCELAA
jgi:hypothetical protein